MTGIASSANPSSEGRTSTPIERLHDVDPTLAIAHEAMSEAHDLKEYAKVVELGKAWIEAREGLSPLAAVWYSNGLQAMGDLWEAKRWAIIAVKNIPKDEPDALAAAYGTLSLAEARLGRYADARKAMRKMVEQPCKTPDAIHKQGLTKLTIDTEWFPSWRQCEERLKVEGNGFPDSTRPWDGVTKEPIAVMHEQGIGDTILMARWFGKLAKDVEHPVTFYGPEMFRRYFGEHPDIRFGSIKELEEAPEKSIAGIRVMSLPYYAGLNRKAHIPPPWGPPRLVEQRRMRKNGVKIGVCWKGNKGGWHDFERSIHVEIFQGIWEGVTAPVEWVNLCHDADVPESAPFGRAYFTDLLHTAEEAAQCDLIVTVDTGVAHLAGSLGIPTICLVPCAPDWRYTWPQGVTSPWYPSMTVLRPRFMHDPARLDKCLKLVNQFAGSLARAS